MDQSTKIIDNFIEPSIFEHFKKTIVGNNTIPWFLNHGISTKNTYNDEGIYFTHTFYTDYNISSQYFGSLNPIFEKINPKAIIRARANVYPKTNKIVQHGMHIDYPYEHFGLIVYLNTNNGFTILEDGTKVESIENRALFFDPSKNHCSTTCTDSFFRSIVIVNYF
jgi:hypothetical protein